MYFNLSFEQQSCRVTFGCGASIWLCTSSFGFSDCLLFHSLFVVRRCVYAVAVCTMPRGLVSGAPLFSLFCGGDKHPTAHVWRWGRASRRICFQSGEAFFFQRWRRATCCAARPEPKPSNLVVELALASGWSICLRSCAQELGREYRRLFP